MNKNEAKKNIQKLIDKYQAVVKSGKINKYSEEETKKDFILPLFEILGWDVHDKNEVSAEESQASGGRVDYGFYLNATPKFFLEAKAFKQDIHKEEFAKQAIRYSWNKGVTWAILTNFETIIVFNAQDIESRYLGDKRLFEIPCNEYIKRFDQLWQLSRESLETNAIDKYAEQIGKKLQRIPISEILYKDISECRAILTKYLSISNPKVDKDLIDEGVQKLLDRLIFIRVAEDRKIEPPTLKPILHEWDAKSGAKGGRGKITLYKAMISKFRELDKIYDSNLFLPHPFENWDDNNDTLEKVIPILYGKEGYYEYDFKDIPADVLGSVYENYLGYRLSKSKKGTTISKDAKKRKEQGIYYTPTFIVDYIVRNALKPVLDQCQSIHDLKKIKVLDPACGSGSFLIKALEVINEKYKYLGYNDPYTKFQILTQNIYGVDLDEQAVQIAQLNLLVSALDERVKLPILTNIKNGNSLISGTDEELKKYFGPNFREKKPFNWEEEFPEVFEQGGFDVIIGNPPWVSAKGKHKSIDFDSSELRYFTEVLNANTYRPNLFEIFIWKSLSLIKNGGILSFIVPDRLCSNEQFKKLREYILSNYSILNLLFRVEFPGIIGDTVVFVIGRGFHDTKQVKIQVWPSLVADEIPQKYFENNPGKEFIYSSSKNEGILKKINNNAQPLIEKFQTSVGFIAKSGTLSKERQNKYQIKILKGKNIGRYQIRGSYYFEFEKKNLVGGTQDKTKLGFIPKIFLRKTGINLIAAFDNRGLYPEQSLYFIYGNSENTVLALLGIINSKFMNWYYYNFAITNKESTPQLKKIHLDKFPIPITFESKELILLVKKMLNRKDDFMKETENSNRWHKIKDEIAKTDKKIDEEVYKLYSLTREEIKIVENNAK